MAKLTAPMMAIDLAIGVWGIWMHRTHISKNYKFHWNSLFGVFVPVALILGFYTALMVEDSISADRVYTLTEYSSWRSLVYSIAYALEGVFGAILMVQTLIVFCVYLIAYVLVPLIKAQFNRPAVILLLGWGALFISLLLFRISIYYFFD